MFDSPQQPVSFSHFQKRRNVQGGILDRYCHLNFCALVPRKSRRLAVLISLCHDFVAMDVPFAHKQRATKTDDHRERTLRRVGSHQRNGRLALSLDRQNSAVANALWLQVRKFSTSYGMKISAILTKKIVR